jgi:hypothetical protein
VRTLEERAGKRQPLLFSAGEHVFPARVFIEPIERMNQAHVLDGGPDHGVVDLLGRERIRHGTA